MFAADGRAQQVEDRLADAVFHGSGARVAGVKDFPAAEAATDDADAGRRRVLVPRFAAAGRSGSHGPVSARSSGVCQTSVDMVVYDRRGAKPAAGDMPGKTPKNY